MRIFVAYPYRQYPLDEYRALFESLEKLFDVKFVFADETITSLHILQKIEGFIRSSAFSIFDITGWNANVALELGLALGMVGMERKVYIAINPDAGPLGDAASEPKVRDAPSDLRGIDRIQFASLGEMRRKLHMLLRERFGIKGRVFQAPDVLWNPRGRPKPTTWDYAAAFRDTLVHLVPSPRQSEQMLVDLSVQVESRDWTCVNDDNAPWMHIDFLDRDLQKVEVRESMHWFPLEFKPNQSCYHYQQKVLVSDRWAEIEAARVWAGAGYAQNTVWYKNWSPHMIHARLRQVVTSSRRRLSRF